MGELFIGFGVFLLFIGSSCSWGEKKALLGEVARLAHARSAVSEF